jgi:hypothetical protein
VSDWRALAACRGQDGRWWFTNPQTDPTGHGLAERICAGCPVRKECATEALRLEATSGPVVGVWAGVTVGQAGSFHQLQSLAGGKALP